MSLKLAKRLPVNDVVMPVEARSKAISMAVVTATSGESVVDLASEQQISIQLTALPSVDTLRLTHQHQAAHVSSIIYGIRNCDTMKKARAWLDGHGVEYDFHDYKVAGIDRKRLERWSREVGWEVLLNRAGTTFRKLPEKQRLDLDAGKAIELMLEQPSMIKRPVLELPGKIVVGFKPQTYAELFAA